MAHNIAQNNFTYLAILYEEDLPVIDLFAALLAEHFDFKHCTPIERMVSKDDNFEKIVYKLIQDEKAARIVVVLAHDEISEKITRAVMKTKTEGEILWLGGDSWMHIMLYLGGPKASISISHENKEIIGFDQHFKSLDSSTEIPWFVKGMKDNFDCTTNECIRDVMSDLELQLGLAYIYQVVMVYGTALNFFSVGTAQKRSTVAHLSVSRKTHRSFTQYCKTIHRLYCLAK
jgi:Receptor family ligand binding region